MHRLPLNYSRRRFLHQAIAVAGIGAAVSPVRRARAQEVDPIEIGFVGLRSRGSELLNDFNATRQVHVAWLCDVHGPTLDAATKRVNSQQARPAKTTDDFRRMLEDRRVQAIVIATPDHWHAAAAMLALKAGKAVYLEAPLAHNPREGELLIETVRRTRGLLQVGLQLRSVPWVTGILQRIRAGEFGPIHFARAWFTGERPSIGFGQLAPVPEGLQYDLWQGPAPERPFRDNLLPGNWRWFWNWGTGELGLNGVHWLDLARWGLRLECPLRVASAGGRYHFEDDQETPDTQTVTYDFGRHTLVWEHRSCLPQPVEGETAGVAFLGDKASVILGPSGYRIRDPHGKEIDRHEGSLSTAPHVAGFLAGFQNRATTNPASVEDAHASTQLCHLGSIAHRVGRSLRLNPDTRQVRDDRDAAALWHRSYRPSWEPAP